MYPTFNILAFLLPYFLCYRDVCLIVYTIFPRKYPLGLLFGRGVLWVRNLETLERRQGYGVVLAMI